MLRNCALRMGAKVYIHHTSNNNITRSSKISNRSVPPKPPGTADLKSMEKGRAGGCPSIDEALGHSI